MKGRVGRVENMGILDARLSFTGTTGGTGGAYTETCSSD